MMKTEEIKDQFKQFESIVCDYHGVKCWSVRELYSLLGYTQWRNFETIINKAKAAARMQVNMWPTILLMSAKWFLWGLVQKERQMISILPVMPVSYTHLRAHETPEHLVCRLLLEKKNFFNDTATTEIYTV